MVGEWRKVFVDTASLVHPEHAFARIRKQRFMEDIQRVFCDAIQITVRRGPKYRVPEVLNVGKVMYTPPRR